VIPQKIASVFGAGAVAVVSLLVATPGATVRAATSSTSTVYPVTTQGVVAPASTTTTTTGQAPLQLSKGARSIGAQSAPSAAQHPPSAPANASASGARLLHNFDGVSSLDSELTNYRLRFEPPDQGLCMGNGFLLEAVNSAYRIYHTDGSTIEGPFNINDLFNEGGQEFTSDPRCHFDPTTNTWFAIILFISADASSSHLDIAVNPSGDPTTLWTEYRIDTTTPDDRGCPCFGDQPHLGIDQFNLYVSSDEFSILGPRFNGADIQAFAKKDLIAGDPVHFVRFAHLHIAGTRALTIEPAISTGKPNAGYFMESLDPNGTFDNRLGVWALTERERVAAGGHPILSSTVITSEPYGRPVPAAQKGSKSTIDAGDDRMQQVQYIAGNLWGELTTSVTIPNDRAPRDGAAWFTVQPSLDGDRIGTPAVVNQGYVVSSGAYVIYPALQADAAGRAAMVFTVTSRDIYPSAAYAARSTGQPRFSAPVIAAAGTGPYDKAATRWGDYSWAVLNPAADHFWLATEYIPPPSSQTTNGHRNWGTRVLDLLVS
jgi:hypothetical protein